MSAMPGIVGIGAMVIGSISVITSFGNGVNVINSGAGSGVNAFLSGLAIFAGYKIYKTGNVMAAWMFGGLITALIVYGGFQLNAKRAIDVVSATTSAVIDASSKAAGAAINSVQRPTVVKASFSGGGLKPNHRWLTDLELEWCGIHESNNLGCRTKQCNKSKCNATGKTKADVKGK